MTGRAYMGEVLMQIWLSELLDKQVNVQKESLKIKLPGFTQASASPQKVYNENEGKKKKENNDCHINKFFVKGRTL